MKLPFTGTLLLFPSLAFYLILSVTAAPPLDSFFYVTKVFETEDEVLLKILVESSRPIQYVIRTKENSGESASYNSTAPATNSNRCEGHSWIVLSRVFPTGEDRAFEKIIVRHGAVNPTQLYTNVRVLPKNPKAFRINARLAGARGKVQLNQPLEIAASEDLAIQLIVGEQLQENPER